MRPTRQGLGLPERDVEPSAGVFGRPVLIVSESNTFMAPDRPDPACSREYKPLSIAPPSDIVLDVAQAADPLKLQAATAKLARMAAGAGAGDFDATLTAAAAPRAAKPLASSFGTGTTLWRTTPAPQSPSGSVYQKFEAVLLQNFVQNILPKDENLFGDAASADIMRTMMAEQLATQLAKSGRIGIAKMIAGAHPAATGAKSADPVAEAPAPQTHVEWSSPGSAPEGADAVPSITEIY